MKKTNCPHCDGTGYDTPACGNPPRCPHCKGAGWVIDCTDGEAQQILATIAAGGR